MIKLLLAIIIVTSTAGCASKFAPVVSRPDNLIIDCPTGCKFNIPMNTEIVVARNTNGYDMGIAALKQIPFIGALALSWKSMDTAENIAEKAIDSFNRGSQGGSPSTVTNTTTTNTTGDTITTGDTVSTATDSSGSGNSSSADVAETNTTTTTGDTIDVGGDAAGGDIDKSTEDNDLDYSNRSVTYPQSP